MLALASRRLLLLLDVRLLAAPAAAAAAAAPSLGFLGGGLFDLGSGFGLLLFHRNKIRLVWNKFSAHPCVAREELVWA